jgi:LacI family transcriptional regulator
VAQGRLPEPRTRATILDVASAAGVSRQTVSNVVNNPERVAPDTLDRVRREIDRLGFSPNAAAQQLRRRHTRAYGFEINPPTSRRMGHVLDGFLVELTMAAPAHDSHLVTFSPTSEDSIRDYERLLATGLVDGFVITDTMRDDPRPAWLLENSVPFVSFGRSWDTPDFGRWVDVDGRSGMEDAVAHALDAGYAQVAYLGWLAGSPLGDDRRRGWMTGLAAADHTDALVSEECADELSDATRAAERLLDRLDEGSAILCASDMLALGAVRAMRNRRLEPGKDIGLVGFDDSTVAEALQLTSLRQPLREAAEMAWRILHDANVDQSAPTLLRPELVVRSTTTRQPQRS